MSPSLLDLCPQICAGLVMIGVIIASRRVGINPDNVATPIAASLGDLITLSLLAGISTGLYKELGTQHTLTGCRVKSVLFNVKFVLFSL